MEDYVVEEFEFDNGVTGKIHLDPEPLNPRTEYDGHIAKLLCAHGRYDLGDEQFRDPDDIISHIAEMDGVITKCSECKTADVIFSDGDWHHDDANIYEEGWELCPETWKTVDVIFEGVTMQPLFLYDHSGITMSTGAFSCPWDSGQVGIGVVVHQDLDWIAEDEWEVKAAEIIEGAVTEYDSYLTGQVYGYVVESENGDHESCWGYFDQKDCEGQLKAVAEHMVKSEGERLAKEEATRQERDYAGSLILVINGNANDLHPILDKVEGNEKVDVIDARLIPVEAE